MRSFCHDVFGDCRRAVPLLILFPLLAGGCGNSSQSSETPTATTVLVDLKSGDVFTAATVSALPEKHPQTGKRTLMPALFCTDCGRWYPVPPAEERQRNPRSLKCPKHGTPMTIEGPVPPTSGVL